MKALLLADDYDAMLELAREQIKGGARSTCAWRSPSAPTKPRRCARP
jgi:hypothetical protein